MTQRRVAFVTGASRGIGAACAVALAEQGFDLVISARTVTEGTGTFADGSPAPGSLATTMAAVRGVGRWSVPVAMDLTDPDSVEAGSRAAIEAFGHVDVLVNNGVYKGPGDMAPLLGTPLDLIERSVRADILSQLQILQAVLPSMVERGRGVVVNMTSMVAHMEPPGPIGKGGWGMAYGVAKGGFDRIAGLLNAELGEQGIVAYNIHPGFVVYGERAEQARQAYPGIEITPPEAIGAAVAWLATSPDAPERRNQLVHGPELAASIGWTPPVADH